MKHFSSLFLLSLCCVYSCKPPIKAKQKNFEAEESGWFGSKKYHTLVMLAPSAAVEEVIEAGVPLPPTGSDLLANTPVGPTGVGPTNPMGTGTNNTMGGGAYPPVGGGYPPSNAPSVGGFYPPSTGLGTGISPSVGGTVSPGMPTGTGSVGGMGTNDFISGVQNLGTGTGATGNQWGTGTGSQSLPGGVPTTNAGSFGGNRIPDSYPSTASSGFAKQYSAYTTPPGNNDVFMCWYAVASDRSLSTGNPEDRKKMYTMSQPGDFTATPVSILFLVQEMQKNSKLRDLYRSAAGQTAKAVATGVGTIAGGVGASLAFTACTGIGFLSGGIGAIPCYMAAAATVGVGFLGGNAAGSALTDGRALQRIDTEMRKMNASTALKKITFEQLTELKKIVMSPQGVGPGRCKEPGQLNDTDFAQIFASKPSK